MKIANIEYKPGLLLDIYLPNTIVNPPIPAVICVRGGGWQRGDKEQMGPTAQTFSNRGYAGVSIQYRVPPQYPYPAALQDVQDAISFIRANAAQRQIDPGAIGLFGKSAGGHLVSLAGCLNNPAVQAVVSVSGLYDFVLAIPDLDPTEMASVESFLGGSYTDDLYRWREASPITHLNASSAPLLMIHGGEDFKVPISQPQTMFTTCNTRNARAQMYLIANVGHSVATGPDIPLLFYKSIFGR